MKQAKKRRISEGKRMDWFAAKVLKTYPEVAMKSSAEIYALLRRPK